MNPHTKLFRTVVFLASLTLLPFAPAGTAKAQTAPAVKAQSQTVDTLDPALRERIDRIAAQVLEQTGVASASVAIVQHGKLAYTHAYGKARLAPPMDATP
jgi:CubicO group peptidase (beta-lactamase class C family)